MRIIREPAPASRRLKIRRTPRFWSAHTHSMFSAQDALPSVQQIVDRVALLGQPALGITDHGNIAASVQLYTAAMKVGIKPFPGSELYFVDTIAGHKRDYRDKEVKASRFHLGVLAYTSLGYRNLVKLSTLTHTQHFHKPLLDLASLAQFAQDGYTAGLAVTTGCYFSKTVQTLVNHGEQATKTWLATLASWFPDSVYVEIQNHRIDHGDGWNDDLVADALVAIADDLGLPVVVTQDAHYVDQGDRVDHDALKRLVSFGTDPDETVFPGDGFHLADDAWIGEHHPGARGQRGLEGLDDLLSRHDLAIGPLDRYHYSVPLPVPDPSRVLRERCGYALIAKGLEKKAYLDRLAEELEVIEAAGFPGYLLLAADVADFCASNKIVFQVRGSAGGALVCYLLGITSADPIKWGLRFERFLSKDRMKPPDVDFDIEDQRRDEVLRWLSSKYAVHQIGTWAEMGLSGDEDGSKGSLLVKYYSQQRKVGGPTTWEQVPPEHRAQLYRLADYAPFSGPGTNAAGMVITSTKAQFSDLVPVMHMAGAKAGAHKLLAQYEKDDIEKLGLVKLDVMGLKTLSVIAQTLRGIGRVGLDWIPLADQPTYSFIRTGRTEGIFQLSGGATSRGLRDLKPTKISDVIAAMALFRPATMKSGATEAYIRRKNGEEKIPERHEIIMAATKDTRGILLYQEQVIDVLRRLGMGADDLTAFLKAVKASNKDVGGAGQVIENYMVMVHQLSSAAGLSEADMAWLEQALDAFAGYSFNAAHATIYGITAYRAAYLAVHHPVEYHAALLGVYAGDKAKEPRYLTATRSRGIRVLRADINVSGYTYTADIARKAVRKGLLAVPGVGKVAAAELIAHQPYTDLKDLATRVDHRKVTGIKDYRETGNLDEACGSLAALVEAGCLESIV